MHGKLLQSGGGANEPENEMFGNNNLDFSVWLEEKYCLVHYLMKIKVPIKLTIDFQPIVSITSVA